MKLTNIQILRALAAIAVVIYHTGIETTGVCKAVGLPCLYEGWLGAYGVNLFFMISGFIMVVTSWNSFGKSGATWAFLEKRLKRIVPLYWFVTTLAVVGIFFVPSMLNVSVLEPSYVLASYLFWPMERMNGLVRPIANLGWTLNLEMFFYAVFAAALFFGRVRGLLLAVGFLLGLVAMHGAGEFAANGPLASIPLNFWADPIILNFIMGIGVGVLYMKDVRTKGWENLALLAIAAASLWGVQYDSDILLAFPENHVVPRFTTALPMLPILIAGALGPQLDVSKLWGRGALLLGDASYSLYLIHPFALRPFKAIWVKFVGTDLPLWSFSLACVVLALVVGLGCYVLAERPFTNYFSRKRSPTPKPAIADFGSPFAFR
jgi:exopolysaccharide production protein ExoZ